MYRLDSAWVAGGVFGSACCIADSLPRCTHVGMGGGGVTHGKLGAGLAALPRPQLSVARSQSCRPPAVQRQHALPALAPLLAQAPPLPSHHHSQPALLLLSHGTALSRSVLYLAYRHADSFEDAVLANTNVGGGTSGPPRCCFTLLCLWRWVPGSGTGCAGRSWQLPPPGRARMRTHRPIRRPRARLHTSLAENCHRGAALGAIVGAAHGARGIPPRLVEGLHEGKAIAAEISDYIHALYPEAEGAEARQAAAAGAGGAAGEL